MENLREMQAPEGVRGGRGGRLHQMMPTERPTESGTADRPPDWRGRRIGRPRPQIGPKFEFGPLWGLTPPNFLNITFKLFGVPAQIKFSELR